MSAVLHFCSFKFVVEVLVVLQFCSLTNLEELSAVLHFCSFKYDVLPCDIPRYIFFVCRINGMLSTFLYREFHNTCITIIAFIYKKITVSFLKLQNCWHLEYIFETAELLWPWIHIWNCRTAELLWAWIHILNCRTAELLWPWIHIWNCRTAVTLNTYLKLQNCWLLGSFHYISDKARYSGAIYRNFIFSLYTNVLWVGQNEDFFIVKVVVTSSQQVKCSISLPHDVTENSHCHVTMVRWHCLGNYAMSQWVEGIIIDTKQSCDQQPASFT